MNSITLLATFSTSFTSSEGSGENGQGAFLSFLNTIPVCEGFQEDNDSVFLILSEA